MNILYVSDKKKWGGVVSWMEKTALGLQERGHNVWIFSHPNSQFTKNASESLNLIPFKIGNEHNPLSLYRLISFIRNNKIQLVLSNVKKESVICAKAAKITGISHIRRIGNEKDLNHPAVQKLYKRKMIDSTITPCRDMINKIVEKHDFVNESDFDCIYNGRNHQMFSSDEIAEFKREFDLPEQGLIIGVLCQLVKPKNVAGIIRSFKKIVNDFRNVYLVIAGKGPEEDNLKKMIADSGIQANCLLIGFVKDTEKFSALTDIGILFSDIEGFSNSVVEFMSVGTPVICSDVGGQREIIRSGINGYLVESGNEKDLADRIISLIKDESKLCQFGNKAFQTVKDDFSEDKMIRDIEDLYKQTINSKRDII